MLGRRQKPGSPAGLVTPHRRCFLPHQSYSIGEPNEGARAAEQEVDQISAVVTETGPVVKP
jgi:hypothetical protein